MATQTYGHYYRVVFNPYENINAVHTLVEQQKGLSKEQCAGIKTFFTKLFSKDGVNTSVRATLVSKLTTDRPDQTAILKAIGDVAFRRETPYQMFMYQYSQALLAMFQQAADNMRPEEQKAASAQIQLREISVQDQTMLRCAAAFIESMGPYYNQHTQELIQAMEANSPSRTLAALESNINAHTVGYGQGAWKGTFGRVFG